MCIKSLKPTVLLLSLSFAGFGLAGYVDELSHEETQRLQRAREVRSAEIETAREAFEARVERANARLAGTYRALIRQYERRNLSAVAQRLQAELDEILLGTDDRSGQPERAGGANLQIFTDLPDDHPALRQIQSGVHAVRKMLSETPADVHAYRDLSRLTRAYAQAMNLSRAEAERHWSFSTAISGHGSLFIAVDRARQPGQPEWVLFKLAAHEYTHVHCNSLMNRPFGGSEDQTPNDGPYWLAEGVAEYIAHLAMADVGHGAVWTSRREQLIREIIPQANRPLDRLGPWKNMAATNAAYDISHLAVEVLANETSLDKVVNQYWKARANGGRWEDTFQQTFGFTVNEFYDAFDRWVRRQ